MNQNIDGMISLRSGANGVELNLGQRIGSFLNQSEHELLLRRGNQVTEHQINTFFAARQERFKFFDDAAAFSEIVYKDAVFDEEGKAIIDGDTLEVSPEWVAFDGDKLPARPTGDGTTITFNNHLVIRVWVNQAAGEAMITFRGSTAAWQDWFTNFRWLTVMPFRAILAPLRLIPGVGNRLPQLWDHYDLTRRYMPALVDALHKAYGEIKINAVGHSLGGGLAQQAAYSSPHIQTVFAFNPSPVTGFFCVPRTERVHNKRGVYITRIYEKGEFLAYARFVTRLFNPLTRLAMSESDPEIEEIRFNFMQADTVTEHKLAGMRNRLEARFNKMRAGLKRVCQQKKVLIKR